MTLSASPAARETGVRGWQALGRRLQTVTPRAAARGALTVAAIVIPAWVAVQTWPALLPFAAGAVLAYAVLPVANWLDRFLPRVLASILAVALAVAVLLGALVLVVPPLVNGVVDVISRLPTPDQTEAALAQLQAQIGTLPEPFQGIVLAVVTEVVANLQGALAGFVENLGTFITSQILGVLDTASFVLGLLVIPVWILTILSDDRLIKRRSGEVVAPAMRADARALIRIADRALSTFLRVRVVMAITTAFLVWGGLAIARELGLGEFRFAVAGGVLLGALQLIPELGFFLGFFPILLIWAIAGPVPALVALVVYVAAVRISSTLLETRISRGVLDVHPGLLIPAIVALSQLGPVWLLAAAPAVAIARDTVRYLAGRRQEPPRPAGVIPGERATNAARTGALARVPSVYRHGQATPRSAVAPTLPPVPSPAAAGASLAVVPAAASPRSPQP